MFVSKEKVGTLESFHLRELAENAYVRGVRESDEEEKKRNLETEEYRKKELREKLADFGITPDLVVCRFPSYPTANFGPWRFSQNENGRLTVQVNCKDCGAFYWPEVIPYRYTQEDFLAALGAIVHDPPEHSEYVCPTKKRKKEDEKKLKEQQAAREPTPDDYFLEQLREIIRSEVNKMYEAGEIC